MTAAKNTAAAAPAAAATGNEIQSRNLKLALGQIEKEFGKGSIMRLGDQGHIDIPAISTGSMALDIATGIGGLPRGRIIEIYGPEASGKTTLCLHVIANAQKNGGTCAFIDTEHALDPRYARVIGVDTDNLLVSQPDCGEDALNIADTLVRSNAIDVLVIDSVAALVPKAEIEGEMGDQHVGLQARLMSQALRKLTGAVSKSNCIIIFINQLREKVGVMFGNPETTTGGKALKFYASVRLDVRRGEVIKSGTDVIGNRTRVKVVKNKVAPPFKVAEFDMIYGEGVSHEGSLLDMAVNRKIIAKSGAWYNYGELRLGQGRENARSFLRDNPELADEIEKKLRSDFEEERKKAVEAAEAKRAAAQKAFALSQDASAPAPASVTRPTPKTTSSRSSAKTAMPKTIDIDDDLPFPER